MQPDPEFELVVGGEVVSQSPYGAKWFATSAQEEGGMKPTQEQSQSPYGAKWFATWSGLGTAMATSCRRSQSPYGAKWFATIPVSLAYYRVI